MTERASVEPTTTEQDPTEVEMVQLRQEVAQLRYALSNRPQTDRVVGMIMLAASCSADTAWARSPTISQTPTAESGTWPR